MKTIYAPIVGLSFRPTPTRELFSTLPVGQTLILDPEPENPHDPDAIRVCVNFWDLPELPGFGASKVASSFDGDIIHVGYIPKSGGKFDTTGVANKEVLAILQSGPDWNATLTFSPAGAPLVKIEASNDEA